MKRKANHIGVLVVSAYSLVRRGMVSALDNEDNITVVDHASNRLELLEKIGKLKPDIVIVNDDRDINSLETIRLITQRASAAKILLLIKDYNEEKELEALKMGVRGFLPEGTGKSDFIKCVKAIDKGEMWIRRKVMERLVQELLLVSPPGGAKYPSSPTPSLTERELKVLTLVAKDRSDKQIAKNMSVSEKTVKRYLSNILKKLHIKDRSDVKRYLELSL